MRNLRTAAVLLGLVTLPSVGFAASGVAAQSKAASPKATSTAQVATHATKGIVKSIEDTRLVIARSPNNSKETIFVLSPSTRREGNLQVGSTVEVRYRTQGNDRMATVISVQEPKPMVAHKAEPKK